MSVELVELRILDGPNIYFPRPAIKLSLAVPGWQRATAERLDRLAAALDLPPSIRAGERNSDQRLRFAARVAAQCARATAASTGTRLGVRGRPAPDADRIALGPGHSIRSSRVSGSDSMLRGPSPVPVPAGGELVAVATRVVSMRTGTNTWGR